MQKPGFIKKFMMVLGFLVMLATGYTTTSVVTSCPAQAQACVCGICIYAAQGMASVLAQIGSGIIMPAITAATGIVIAYSALAFTAFSSQVSGKMATLVLNFVGWFDTFFGYNLKPAMQMQTRQLATADVDQSRSLSGLTDAQNMSRMENNLAVVEDVARDTYSPGENLCVAGTISGGMARAAVIEEAYNAQAPVEALARSGGRVGTPAAGGRGGDAGARWANYVARYCNPQDNNGNAGCAANGTRVDQDIDVTGQIFERETINLTDPEVKRTVDDLVINIAEPFVRDHVPTGSSNSASGREAILNGEAYKAKRQTVYDALYHPISRRAPGSGMQNFLRPMREAAGVNAADISANPSKNEIMQVMMSERFRTGKYSISQIDAPANNDREIVIQQAFQVMQLSDQLDLLDRYSLMLAADVGYEIGLAKPLEGKSQMAPVR